MGDCATTSRADEVENDPDEPHWMVGWKMPHFKLSIEGGGADDLKVTRFVITNYVIVAPRGQVWLTAQVEGVEIIRGVERSHVDHAIPDARGAPDAGMTA